MQTRVSIIRGDSQALAHVMAFTLVFGLLEATLALGPRVRADRASLSTAAHRCIPETVRRSCGR